MAELTIPDLPNRQGLPAQAERPQEETVVAGCERQQEQMSSTDNLPGMDAPQLAARACLLLCARSRTGDSGHLASLLGQGIDWQYLLDEGQRHGVLPLVYECLHRLGFDLVPRDVKARLQDVYRANLRRVLRLQASLAEAVTALQQEGIEPIVLKGGALADTVYANPGLRPMVDLDLLVRPGAMKLAGSVLADMGYHLSGNLPARMVAFQQRFGGGLEWQRDGDFALTRIDLQHNLVGVDLCRHAFPIEPEALWAEARSLPLDRGQALQLSAEDTLIHLCLHPPLHHGYAVSLIGTVDIDWLVAREGSDEFWDRLVARARQFRVRMAVFHCLCSAQDLLGTPVPAVILDALAPSALRQRLLERLAPLDEERVWAGVDQQPSGLHQLLIYITLMERPWDALGMVWMILFPNQEWLAVRYGLGGKWQAGLYRLVHPFRVARALLRSLHRPLVQSGLE